MNRMTTRLRTLVAFPLLALTVTISGTARADASALVGQLVQQLGVSQQQATGGAGAIFDYVKSKLSAQDFTTVANAIPGLDGLIAAAPKSSAGSSLSSLASGLGVNTGSAAGAADLAGAFSKLGLSSEIVNQFIPVVLDYAKSQGGETVMNLLKGVLI